MTAVEIGRKIKQLRIQKGLTLEELASRSELTKKAICTTIFVKNAPSYAGIGFNAEGWTTFTIAGPTGEGITSPRSFTRQRRCVLSDALNII